MIDEMDKNKRYMEHLEISYSLADVSRIILSNDEYCKDVLDYETKDGIISIELIDEKKVAKCVMEPDEIHIERMFDYLGTMKVTFKKNDEDLCEMSKRCVIVMCKNGAAYMYKRTFHSDKIKEYPMIIAINTACRDKLSKVKRIVTED